MPTSIIIMQKNVKERKKSVIILLYILLAINVSLMKINYKLIFTLLILFIVLVSCGAPPENTPTLNFLELVSIVIGKAMDAKGDKKKQISFMDEANSIDAILAVYKGSKIVIQTEEVTPTPDDVVYSLGNNQFKQTRTMYITAGHDKNEMIFSLDGKTWYSSKNDLKKDIENVVADYYFITQLDEATKTLFVTIRGAMKLGKTLTPLKDPPLKRETVYLKPGMVFAHLNKSKITVDLNEKILYLPVGTIYSGKLFTEGNLIKTDTFENGLTIKFLKTLFVYVKHKNISISFDKQDWGVSILSFSLSPFVEVFSTEDGGIYLDGHIKANYRGK